VEGERQKYMVHLDIAGNGIPDFLTALLVKLLIYSSFLTNT